MQKMHIIHWEHRLSVIIWDSHTGQLLSFARATGRTEWICMRRVEMKRWDRISPGKLCTKLEESPLPRSLIGAVATAAVRVRRLVPMRQAQWNFSVQSNWIQGRLFCCFSAFYIGEERLGLDWKCMVGMRSSGIDGIYSPSQHIWTLPCRLTRSADHKSPQLFVFVAVTHATLPWWQTSPQNVLWFLDKHHLNCLTRMICPVVSVLDLFFLHAFSDICLWC